MLHIYSAHFQSTVQLKPTVSGVQKSQESEVFRAVPNICEVPTYFCIYNVRPQTQFIKPSLQVSMQSAEKYSSCWEPEAKTKERTMNIQSQMRDLDSVQLALSCFQDADSNKSGEAIRQGVLRMIAGSKETVKDMKSLLTRLQYLVSSHKVQGHMHHHLYCWTMELMIHITCLQLKKK